MTILLLLLTLVACQEPALSPDISKWESAVSKLESANETESASRGIVYYGSSSIRLWKTIKDDMAPWPTIQRGYGGAKLPDIIHYAPRVIGPHLGTSNPKRCRALVLFVANDIAGKDKDATPDEVVARFARLHQWVRQQDPTVPVFWIEVTPSNSRWQVWPQIEMATKGIKKFSQSDPNTHVISTAGAFLGLDGKPRKELFVQDQLHLNADGYQQWSGLIKAQLHAHLGAADPQVVASGQSENATLKTK